MDRLEILIDNLLIYLPNDIPFLVNLIERPEGRYIVQDCGGDRASGGLDVANGVANDVFCQRPQPVNDKTPPIELSELLTLITLLMLRQKLVTDLVSLKKR